LDNWEIGSSEMPPSIEMLDMPEHADMEMGNAKKNIRVKPFHKSPLSWMIFECSGRALLTFKKH